LNSRRAAQKAAEQGVEDVTNNGLFFHQGAGQKVAGAEGRRAEGRRAEGCRAEGRRAEGCRAEGCRAEGRRGRRSQGRRPQGQKAAGEKGLCKKKLFLRNSANFILSLSDWEFAESRSGCFLMHQDLLSAINLFHELVSIA
jgi:hypothetical protein